MGIEWDLVLRSFWYDLYSNWADLIALGADLVFVLGYPIFRRSLHQKHQKRFTIMTVLMFMHLVLGSLALWFDNRLSFGMLTLVLWGPASLLALPLKSKGSKEVHEPTVDENATMNPDEELTAPVRVEYTTEQGQADSDEEEPPSDQRRRRGRRIRG